MQVSLYKDWWMHWSAEPSLLHAWLPHWPVYSMAHCVYMIVQYQEYRNTYNTLHLNRVLVEDSYCSYCFSQCLQNAENWGNLVHTYIIYGALCNTENARKILKNGNIYTERQENSLEALSVHDLGVGERHLALSLHKLKARSASQYLNWLIMHALESHSLSLHCPLHWQLQTMGQQSTEWQSVTYSWGRCQTDNSCTLLQEHYAECVRSLRRPLPVNTGGFCQYHST